MSTNNTLHETIGELSILTYVISSLLIAVAFVSFNMWSLPILITLHSIAVLIALFSAVGMGCWFCATTYINRKI